MGFRAYMATALTLASLLMPQSALAGEVKELEGEIRDAIVERKLDDFSVTSFEGCDDRVVIVLADNHPLTLLGMFNPILDIIAPKIDCFGIEGIPAGYTLTDILRLEDEQGLVDDTLKSNGLKADVTRGSYVASFHSPYGDKLKEVSPCTFGYEDLHLAYKEGPAYWKCWQEITEFCSTLRTGVLMRDSVDVQGGRMSVSDFVKESIVGMNGEIKEYNEENSVDLPCIPLNLFDGEFPFPVYEEYSARLKEGYFSLVGDTRTQVAVCSVEDKFRDLEGKHPRVIGMMFGKGHETGLRDALEEKCISYIVINNRQVDENFKILNE